VAIFVAMMFMDSVQLQYLFTYI